MSLLYHRISLDLKLHKDCNTTAATIVPLLGYDPLVLGNGGLRERWSFIRKTRQYNAKLNFWYIWTGLKHEEVSHEAGLSRGGLLY